mgnify:FL=1
MYTIGSIAIISFAEIVAAIAFRSWQLRRGSIDAEAHSDGPLGVADHAVRIQRHAMMHAIVHGKRLAPVLADLFYRTRSFVARKTGAVKLIDLVHGRMPHQNGNGTAPSLYLKDITEHKNGIRKKWEKR